MFSKGLDGTDDHVLFIRPLLKASLKVDSQLWVLESDSRGGLIKEFSAMGEDEGGRLRFFVYLAYKGAKKGCLAGTRWHDG